MILQKESSLGPFDMFVPCLMLLDTNGLVGTIPTTISYLDRLRIFSAGKSEQFFVYSDSERRPCSQLLCPAVPGSNALTGVLPDSMFIDMSSLRRLDLGKYPLLQ